LSPLSAASAHSARSAVASGRPRRDMTGSAPAEEAVVIEEVAAGDFKGEASEPSTSGSPVSAMQASKEKAKELSYYYAQSEGTKGFPKDAVVRQEDPLFRADGLGPKKLELASEVNLDNVRWIDTFAFCDDGAVVKLYVDFPEVIKGADIDCQFDRFSVQLIVRRPAPQLTYGVKIKEREGWILEHERNDGFAHEILPEKSKYRVSSSGQKITITLAKKDDKESWHELRKKDIRSTIPR